MGRARGCLETAALMGFALLVGGFVTSTWLRHAGSDAPTGEPGVSAPAFSGPERARIRVEVRNGSGVNGAAGRATDLLRARGFDVVDFGNADRFDHERTVVIDRVDDPRKAREVAAALKGVPIRSEPDSSLFLDVTVMIGEDFEKVLAGGEEEAEPGPGRWGRWLDRLPWVGE